MTSILQRIAKAAIEAYGLRSNDRHFKPKFNKLAEMMRDVRSADVALHPELNEMVEILNENTEENPPVSYVGICEHEKFTMSMFVLKKGSFIPLHDHPRMYGIIKVLRGDVLVRTYTADDADTAELEEEAEFCVTKTSEVLVRESDNVCVLTPQENNFHEISAPNGAAAFLDILFPPYHEDNRVCNYYKLTKSTAKPQKKVYLTRIPPPPHFWTVQISKYVGPPIVEP